MGCTCVFNEKKIFDMIKKIVCLNLLKIVNLNLLVCQNTSEDFNMIQLHLSQT